MRKILLVFIVLICVINLQIEVFCQDVNAENMVTTVLGNAKKKTVGNAEQIWKVNIEYNSKYRTRKKLVSLGYLSDYDLEVKYLTENNKETKYETTYKYNDGGATLEDVIISDDDVVISTKSRKPGDAGFSPVVVSQKGDSHISKKLLKEKSEYQFFGLVFPIFYFYSQELKFDYLGTAVSGNQKAHILGTVLKGDYKVKLYFDVETSDLLLLVADFYDSKLKEDITHKYFFSDYKKGNGLRYAHKVIVHENGEIIEERVITKASLIK